MPSTSICLTLSISSTIFTSIRASLVLPAMAKWTKCLRLGARRRWRCSGVSHAIALHRSTCGP
jgi:hypothetical protein